MMDLAKRVIAATGSRSEITLVPYDEAYEQGFEDMARRIPDTGRVRDARLGAHAHPGSDPR